MADVFVENILRCWEILNKSEKQLLSLHIPYNMRSKLENLEGRVSGNFGSGSYDGFVHYVRGRGDSSQNQKPIILSFHSPTVFSTTSVTSKKSLNYKVNTQLCKYAILLAWSTTAVWPKHNVFSLGVGWYDICPGCSQFSQVFANKVVSHVDEVKSTPVAWM